jgi:translocation and assembly module TamA
MAQHSLWPRVRRWLWRTPVVALCLCAALAHAADKVDVQIHGVDDELKDNVLAYLSFERYKKGGVNLNDDTVERLHNRVEREVEAALRPYGYYEPKVQSDVRQDSNGVWKVTINIDPGEPIIVKHVDVRVDGPGESDYLFRRILRRLPLRPGDRLNHKAYEDIKNDLVRTAATYGYFDAKMIRNELVVDPPNHSANVALEIDTGERYRFGATSIDQHVIRESLFRRYLRYQEGQYYDLNLLLRTQFALDDTQYFSGLEVTPQPPDRSAHIVAVNIKAQAGRRHHYSLAGGYATDTGVRGTVGFDDRRINSLGHSFAMEVTASKVEKYSLQARYTIPFGDPALENFSMRAAIQQEQLADVNTHTFSAGPAVTAITGDYQHVWLVNAMYTVDDDLNGQSTHTLLVPELDIARVPRGYLGEPLFERPLFVTLKGSTTALGSDSTWAQVHIQAYRSFRLTRKWHLLLRGEAGYTVASHFDEVPTVLRFFAGGDNSVRGFAWNDLSPFEQVCNPPMPANNPIPAVDPATKKCNYGIQTYIQTGGKNVLTGTVELVRELPKNLGVAVFMDTGNAFNSFPPTLQYSAGVGFRALLPVLTLGVDLAFPLSKECSPPNYVGQTICSGTGPRLSISFSPKL